MTALKPVVEEDAITIERIHAPSWTVIDQILFRRAFRISFFPYESDPCQLKLTLEAMGAEKMDTDTWSGYLDVIRSLMKASRSK